MEVVLFDIDSRLPNLALMKLSSYYKRNGHRVTLCKKVTKLKADRYFAGAVFDTPSTHKKLDRLRDIYGEDLVIGGTAVDLKTRLPDEVEACVPDYTLYGHTHYALGFLTRGCPKRCPFCVVPAKEGRVKRQSGSFSAFVPKGWQNVMLLDDNLLGFDAVHDLLEEMIVRRYRVNFSQTLDIAYLDEEKYRLLRKIDYQNARFTRNRIYFSLNYPGTIRQFEMRREMLAGFGPDHVSVVSLYGFDTSLSQDYVRWRMLQRLKLVPFFQEYWPIPGAPARLPEPFFDMDLDKVIRLTFRSNGQNWEKYLRWLNRLYFQTFGRYYRPLVEKIYRYNNKERIHRYLSRPGCLTDQLYRSYRSSQDP
ncbi:MAG: hypothetical protein QNK37_33570 [Acidobacteriota bacterium]|nr:hypothetical protein [Acidobacteriota bacterium]